MTKNKTATDTTQGVNSDLILQTVGKSLCEYATDDGNCDELSVTDKQMPNTSRSYLYTSK